jgi:hypothetical protein
VADAPRRWGDGFNLRSECQTGIISQADQSYSEHVTFLNDSSMMAFLSMPGPQTLRRVPVDSRRISP